MLILSKFGGSSLSSGACFLRCAEIIRKGSARRVVVVSAPGRRHPTDQKITDLLYLCHAHAQRGVSCWEIWRRIRERFLSIERDCGVDAGMERALDAVESRIGPETGRDWLASRGEYLSARMMAALLGWQFLDASDWLRFSADGTTDQRLAQSVLRDALQAGNFVTPGFYGVDGSGAVRTFSRGGSDITGALAARALGADLYENWTDVPGILSADPALLSEARPARQMLCEEVRLLSSMGAQVLHESAIAPVCGAGIPLVVKDTFHPELPGTRVCGGPPLPEDPLAYFAVRKREDSPDTVTVGAVCRTDGVREAVVRAAARAGVRKISVQPPCVRMQVEARRAQELLRACSRAAEAV